MNGIGEKYITFQYLMQGYFYRHRSAKFSLAHNVCKQISVPHKGSSDPPAYAPTRTSEEQYAEAYNSAR